MCVFQPLGHNSPSDSEALWETLKDQQEYWLFLNTERPTWLPEALCPPQG